MPPSRTSVLSLLACSLLLGACQPQDQLRTVTEERVTKPTIAADLTEPCADHPGFPDPAVASQRDVANLIVGQYGAWRDCKEHYDALRSVVLRLEGLK